jgi:tRNA(adenine34) deaminase
MHEAFMRRALQWAQRAAVAGEVPVGAVLVRDGEVLGEGANAPIERRDPTAHAEIVALRAAIEPCTMCAGALIHARVDTLVFGAREPRAGAIVSSAAVIDNAGLNHRVAIVEGILVDECQQLLKTFFRARRDARADS